MSQPPDDRSEPDLDADPDVTSSRAGKSGGQDGTYVGATSPDDAIDVGKSGAEARAEQQG